MQDKLKAKGYSHSGASHQKRSFKGYNVSSGSAHEDIDYNNQTLRERGRDLYMSAPVAASALNTVRTNVIGTGLKLRSSIDRELLGMTSEEAEAWQKKTEREFAIWAEDKRSCDATGLNNFTSIQQLVMLSWLMSGDVFVLIKKAKSSALRPYTLRLHVIEADRCRTPIEGGFRTLTTQSLDNGHLIYDGVEVDSGGLVEAYHFSNRHPYEWGLEQGGKEEWIRVKACSQKTGLPNVLHIMNSERPDQYRGVSFLAPVIEPLLQLRRYSEAELTAAVVESFFTAFVKTETDPDALPFNEVKEDGGSDEYEYSMGPGQINVMKPGEDIVFADPKRPAGGFDIFVKAMCDQIGAALEIPRDLLLKQFNASYSASRAALLEAWKSFRMRREWLIDDLCRPVYELWLSEAVARGRIQAPSFFTDPAIRKAYLQADWIGPSQGQLDPVKEITAEILACSEGFSTHEQSTAKLNGGQWDQNIERLAYETSKLKDGSPDPHQSGAPQESEETTGYKNLVNLIWQNALGEKDEN